MAKQAIVELEANPEKKVEKLTFQDLINNRREWQIQQNTFINAPSKQSQDKIIPKLFEECVEKYSNQTAVSFESGSISYSELNAKANQLANYMQKCGVGRNSLVAIYLERSLELVISILAVIKAGGAFLPLSTDDPTNRIRRILQDSCPAKIITTSDLHETINCALSHHTESNIIRINRFFDEKIELDDQNPTHLNMPEDLLYVMYTSGSTGKPKGCMIPHRAVSRVVKDADYIQIQESDIIAQVANSAFDAMTFEMWGALLNGASLHIIPQIKLISASDFTDELKKNNISILFLTTQLLNLIVKNRPDAFDNLKYLLFGGERANHEIIKKLLARKIRHNLEHLNIVHVYGPTETTTFATSFHIKKACDIKNYVPIGKPISDTTTYILDENLQFVPPGVIGELYIGGKGVALGYSNEPRQTTLKFINSPWNEQEKIYRTGDLAFWLPDVGLVYVDRVDTQVKINGFRVEPTEIEAVIIKNRCVKQAVVLTQTDAEGRKKLFAYVSFYQKDKVDFAKFHQYLKSNIPYYMMPSETIQVDHIPLSNNGKVDKVALTEMAGKNILENNIHDIPSNSSEKILIKIWQQLLHSTSINITQNLFDLGVHSLMLNEACSLINSRLNSEQPISVINLLTYPTIQQLANYVNERKKNRANILESPIARATFQRQVLIARNSVHARKL